MAESKVYIVQAKIILHSRGMTHTGLLVPQLHPRPRSRSLNLDRGLLRLLPCSGSKKEGWSSGKGTGLGVRPPAIDSLCDLGEVMSPVGASVSTPIAEGNDPPQQGIGFLHLCL